MKTPMNENIEIDIEYFLFIFIVFYGTVILWQFYISTINYSTYFYKIFTKEFRLNHRGRAFHLLHKINNLEVK